MALSSLAKPISARETSLQAIKSKSLDTSLPRADIGFASDDNAMQVFFSERYEHDSVTLEKASKDKIAEQLAGIIGETIWQRHNGHNA